MQNMSKTALAQQCGTTHKTVTKKQRLLAFCIIIAKRYYNMVFILSVYTILCETYGTANVFPTYFSLKYRHDEMSLEVRLHEGLGTKKVEETRLAKLLQVTV